MMTYKEFSKNTALKLQYYLQEMLCVRIEFTKYEHTVTNPNLI